MSKLPGFMFYTGDWQKDAALRRCSHHAKGVMIDLMCVMFECEERGYLATAGRAWSDDDVARAVGGDRNLTLSGIEELVTKRVVQRDNRGCIYSKRMVLDEQKRRLCAEAGKKGGGNPSWKVKGPPKGHNKGSPKGTLEEEDEVETEDAIESESVDSKSIVPKVFKHYQAFHPRAHKAPSSKSKEWGLITNRIREGYTAEDLCQAIDGCHKSPFHCGENNRGTVYQDLSLIMRDGSQVAKFIEVAESAGGAVVSEKTRRTMRAATEYLNARSNGEDSP